MKQRIGWKQRLLSAVLAVAMCVALLPAQAVAFAEDGPGPVFGKGHSLCRQQCHTHSHSQHSAEKALLPSDALFHNSSSFGDSFLLRSLLQYAEQNEPCIFKFIAAGGKRHHPLACLRHKAAFKGRAGGRLAAPLQKLLL